MTEKVLIGMLRIKPNQKIPEVKFSHIESNISLNVRKFVVSFATGASIHQLLNYYAGNIKWASDVKNNSFIYKKWLFLNKRIAQASELGSCQIIFMSFMRF